MRAPPKRHIAAEKKANIYLLVVFAALLLLGISPLAPPTQAVETFKVQPATIALTTENEAVIQAPAAIITPAISVDKPYVKRIDAQAQAAISNPAISITIALQQGVDAQARLTANAILSANTARTEVEVLKFPPYTPAAGFSQEKTAYNADTGPECAETKFLSAVTPDVPAGLKAIATG